MSGSQAPGATWRFVRFGLLVTGRGEAAFLPDLFRSLASSGHCAFTVIRKAEQLTPKRSHSKSPTIVGTHRKIPDRDAERIGFPARKFLQQHPETFVLLVDDLEEARANLAQDVFDRYRSILDPILGAHRPRASVQFLANMLEAYYFADPTAVESVMKRPLIPLDVEDVESIKHPKGELKKQFPGSAVSSAFDEVEHGQQIVKRLNLRKVLDNPSTCGYLRSLVAWCVAALGWSPSAEYRLDTGIHAIVTGRQVAQLSPPSPGQP